MAEKVIKRKFIQALPTDNPYLSPEYISVLKETFSHRPELLEAYLHGSWDILAGADQVIKDQWITQAQIMTLAYQARRPRLACDPARFGDDETVIYYSETTSIDDQKILGQSSITQVAHECKVMSAKHDNCLIVVEEDFLGGGVLDILRDEGLSPVGFKASGQAMNPDRYTNQRSEAWQITAKKFSNSEIAMKLKEGVMSRHDFDLLCQQLCTPIYRFRAGKTYIEEKEEIKARLHRSPDRADAFVILQWAYDLAEVVPDDAVSESGGDANDWVESYTTPSAF